MGLFNLGRKVKVSEFNIPEWVISKARWLKEVSDDYIKNNLWKPRPEPWEYGKVFMISSKGEVIFGKAINVIYRDYQQMKNGDLLILKSFPSDPSASFSLILDGGKNFNDSCEVLSFLTLEEYRKNDIRSLCIIKAIISSPNQNVSN